MVQTITLTREQQQLARAFGDWQMALVMAHPEVKQPPGWPWVGGSSIREGHPAEPGDWHEYDAKSIRIVGPRVEGADRVVKVQVQWPRLRIWARQLDPDLVGRLRARLKEGEMHRVARVPFAAPVVEGEPARPDSPEYDAAWALWRAEHEDLWRMEAEDLADELAALLDECFPEAKNLCRCEAIGVPHLYVEGMCAA